MIQKLFLFAFSLFLNSSPGNKGFLFSGKWIFFFLLVFQISFGQTCNVVKGGDFPSAASASANWSLQDEFTGWNYSVWAPGEIYLDVDGVNNISLKQNLTGLLGNPLTLSFKVKAQNANRSSSCPTTATLVIKLGGVTYMTITNPASNATVTTSNIATSNGATYSQTGFPLAAAGANFAAIGQGTITLTIPGISGTTADLEFIATTSNIAMGSCGTTWGGDDWMLDDISLIATSPASYNVTGASVCTGSTTTIGLSGSQLGVNYQLQRSGVNVAGSVIAGTGSALDFGSQTATGVYTVLATAGTSPCTTTMTGSVSISPNLPASVNIAASPSGAICYGASVTFTATPTNGGTTPAYQWKLNGVNVGTNSATYTNTTLLNSDVVTCVMTSNATPCLTGSPATSNTITISSGGPTATGVTICAGGSGSLTSSYSCTTTSSNQTASGSGGTSNSTTYGASGSISVNFPALPAGAVVTSVSTTITYTSNSPSWTNELRIQATPPVLLGGAQTDLQVSTTSAAGTITNAAFGTWGTASPVGTWLFRFKETTDDGGVNPDANISNISIIVTYTLPGTLDWYTAGGTKIGSGSPFNPVGVVNSGLSNTNTAGTTTYFAECSSNPGCRTPVAFIINASPAITSISSPAALCSGGSLNPAAPTVTTNGSPVTASGWQLETAVSSGTYSNLTVPYTVAFSDNGKRIRYYAANSCGTTNSNAVVITINNVPTITAISAPAALCPGGSLNPTDPIVTANGSTVTASGWQLETAVSSGTYSNLTVPYTVAFSDNGKKIRYYATNSCGTTNSNAVGIIVNLTPSVPTVGTVIDINCNTNTGSIVLNGLPAGSWTINQSGTAITSYAGNTSSYTVLGLSVGSYIFSVTNASGCLSSATVSIPIVDASSTTWNGTAWSNGLPNATKNAIIASVTPNSPFTADLSACALTINSGVMATVPSGITLTITNGVTVNTDNNLIFENNASLVQINNVTNTGKIIYKRTSSPMKDFDFTYWSSPVAGQTLFDLSPNTLLDKYFSFSGTSWQVIMNGSAVMQPGVGYIIRTPKAGTWPAPHPEVVNFPYSQPVQFKGVPNNGNITSSQSMIKDNFYLIGNPYPSTLNANELLFNNVNNQNVLNGTIYFWTHNTVISNLRYTSDDYASYNGLGGVATSGGPVPLGYIAAGQSFFGSAKANGNVQFNNSMRSAGNNSQFFKPGKTSKIAGLEKHRVWLNMTNTGGAFKQILIGYAEGATNAYDDDFDGLTFDGNSFVDLYSVNGTDNLVIQGRALPFTESDIVPLGYRSTIAGDFTIAINQADGALAGQRIYLEDKQTGTINELTAKNYTFSTKSGTFNNRFVLRYTNTTLGTGDFETVENGITVMSENKTITVNSTVVTLDKVFIYDVSGKQLYKKQNIGNLQLSIQHLPFAQQVLLVKIVLENGNSITRKVIFK